MRRWLTVLNATGTEYALPSGASDEDIKELFIVLHSLEFGTSAHTLLYGIKVE